eukprot:scaffold9104_cov100-Isochrysis_galbana.AAC.6
MPIAQRRSEFTFTFTLTEESKIKPLTLYMVGRRAEETDEEEGWSLSLKRFAQVLGRVAYGARWAAGVGRT